MFREKNRITMVMPFFGSNRIREHYTVFTWSEMRMILLMNCVICTYWLQSNHLKVIISQLVAFLVIYQPRSVLHWLCLSFTNLKIPVTETIFTYIFDILNIELKREHSIDFSPKKVFLIGEISKLCHEVCTDHFPISFLLIYAFGRFRKTNEWFYENNDHLDYTLLAPVPSMFFFGENYPLNQFKLIEFSRKNESNFKHIKKHAKFYGFLLIVSILRIRSVFIKNIFHS